jgi:hypothetical protein
LHWAGFGQENSNTKTQWNSNQNRDGRGSHGSENGDKSAELRIDNVPFNRIKEWNAKLLECRPSTDKKRKNNTQ